MKRHAFRRIHMTMRCRWCGTEYNGPACPVCAYK
jgi:rubrerythrin